MKRFLWHPVSVTLWVCLGLFVLPQLFSSHTDYLDAKGLREAALKHNLLPIPATKEAQRALVENKKNPLTDTKIALGKRLFFDTILSADRTMSCASCHILEEGGDDNLPTAIGIHGQANPFHLNSPTVLNAALAKAQFWDGRAKDVEEQAGGPIQAPFEMGMTPGEVEKRLNAHPAYMKLFNTVFGEGHITFEQVRYAIGAYERTLLTRSAYDRFLEGDDRAISQEAQRGMSLFITKGCSGCHTGRSVGGQSLQKFPLRRYLSDYVGVLFTPNMQLKQSPFPFVNEGGFLGRDDSGYFRVPILRNITKTAPYFHNGAVKELEEVVRIMSQYQLGEVFTPEQIKEVVAFLKSLESEVSF